MSSLHSFANKTVTILTCDGRTLTGKLLGHDQATNLILTSTIERVFSPPESDQPTTTQEHGLFLLRGDNVAVLGLVDEEIEGRVEWENVRAEGLGGMKHS